MGNCLGFGGAKGAKDPDSDGNNKGGKSSTSTTGGGSVSPANKALSTWTSEWEENKWLEDTRSIWTRSLKDLPVHMDLPRLAARLLIYSDGKLVSSPEAESAAQSKVELVYSHLRCLAQSMEQPALDAVIEEKFWDYVHKDGSGDASQQLLRFLVEVITDKSPISGILRALHQKMVFPGFYSIKNNIFDQLPFKDQRGTWFVTVYLKPNSIEVRHRKTQVSRAQADQPSPEFEFDWELQLRMDRALKNMDLIKVHLKELRIGDTVPEARAEEIRSIFGRFYSLDGSDDNDDNDDDNNNDAGSGAEGEGSGNGDDDEGADIIVGTSAATTEDGGHSTTTTSTTSTSNTTTTDGDGDLRVIE